MEPVHLPSKAKDKSDFVIQKDAIKVDTNSDLLNLDSLRKIICLSSWKNREGLKSNEEKWQSVLSELLQVICTNEATYQESVFLASRAYLSLRRALEPSRADFTSSVISYLNLRANQLIDYKRIYLVYDVELFRLVICYGFLQLGPADRDAEPELEIHQTILGLVQPYCMSYTRLTYFAFKILQAWMHQTSKVGLWDLGEHLLGWQQQLEAVLFANWDNAICKANVVSLFAAYLRLMKNKHDNFLPYLFHSCVYRISWCHISKYTILGEICAALDSARLITESSFISSLFNSLTINHLCNASTKVYTNICSKLSSNMWIATFGGHLKNYVITWQTEKKYNALQVLCKCWIEPVVKSHRDIFPHLLDCCDNSSILYQSHLLRIAKKHGLPYSPRQHEDLTLLSHENEFVRLNGFAAHCYDAASPVEALHSSSIRAAKHFLYLNATAPTTYIREDTLGYFKNLLVNLLRRASLTRGHDHLLVGFLEWLHEFHLDCFEPGSCYQRKIFGLRLCRITLQFLQSNDCGDQLILKDPNFKEALRYGPQLRQQLQECGRWKFTNKESVVLLFKLVLDSASDVRDVAASIILDFFEPNIFDDAEKITLFVTALNKCNSCKFFEIESGAHLFKISTKWFPLTNTNKTSLKLEVNCKLSSSIDEFQCYTKFLLKEATHQLALVKTDILKAATQNTPFYGIVTALLMIGFDAGPESHYVDSELLENIMNLAEGAVNFFLHAISAKSSNLEYSSSFEEMGLAINEAIKSSEINYEFDELILSPAQQAILSCIWRSLKVLCELAVAIAKNKHATESIIRRSIDLIVTVSLKCRHKGAIESAGMAISNLTRYLCTKQLHFQLLEVHLKRLLNNDWSTINVTRRGAGLTILLHRMVASDVRSERPLLHMAVTSLICSLQKLAMTRLELRRSVNYDDPCATQLHFLRSLVADKQLQPQLSPYLEQICLVCFEYMTCPVFIVRNASFQLFGALVSRLVGQNSGARSLDFGYGYSLNHFATHFPQLAAHVLLSLQAYCQQQHNEVHVTWQSHANALPLLSLLSKLFVADCVLVDGSVLAYAKQIRSCLRLLLSSPVAQVRNLAAKTFVAGVGLKDINAQIHRLHDQLPASSIDLNRLNGLLSVLEQLHEKRDEESKSTATRHAKIRSASEVRENLQLRVRSCSLWDFWARRTHQIPQRKLCYTIEAQLLRLTRQFKLEIKDDQRVTSAKGCCSLKFVGKDLEMTRPGFFEFVDELMGLYVARLSCGEEFTAVKMILVEVFCQDLGVSFLRHASKQNRNLLMATVDFAVEHFERCSGLLLEEICTFANESIQNIMRSRLIELQYIDISKLKSFAAKLEAASPSRTAQLTELLTYVHVLSLRGSGSYDLFEDLISCVSKERVTLTDYFKCPDHLRQLVVKALEVLLYSFDKLNSKCRVIPFLVTLVLLKDEIDAMRQTIRDAVLNNIILEFKIFDSAIMDELIYETLLFNVASKKSVLGELSRDEVQAFFKKYLSTFEQHFHNANLGNPFDDDNITSYREESKLINLVLLCMLQKVIEDHILDNKKSDIVSDRLFDLRKKIMRLMNVDCENLLNVLNIKYDEYLTLKLEVVNRIYFKNDI